MYRFSSFSFALIISFFTSLNLTYASTGSQPDQIRVQNSLQNLPLRFEKNEGQVSDEVKFLSRGNGYTMYFTPTEAITVLSRAVDSSNTKGIHEPKKLFEPVERETSVLRMAVVGANQKARISGRDKLPGNSNYFKGNDPSKWQKNVSNYKEVRYEEVYPGIDLVYYGNQKKLEYDFVVKPGADPKNIELDFNGTDSMLIDESGDLVLKTKIGKVIQHAPIIYQTIDGKKKTIEGKYIIKDNHNVAFQLAAYNPNHNLVIDPVLGFSTYLGGSDRDFGSGIAIDDSGNIFVTGTTYSADFDVLNEIEGNNGPVVNFSDVFVLKITQTGFGPVLAYSTYLGGSETDIANDIALDTAGNVYVTGSTDSSDFNSVNSIEPHNQHIDVFVFKLEHTGNTPSLSWSTFLGGSQLDFGNGIAVDHEGGVYVTGFTGSLDFNVLNEIEGPSPLSNAIVFKISQSGNVPSLAWSTYLGGSGGDVGQKIAVNALGSIYVTGYTWSIDFDTLNPIEVDGDGSLSDAFILKLSQTGNIPSLLWSTYLGGNAHDIPKGLALDNAGNTYVTGETESSDFNMVNPIEGYNGESDVFVTKISENGNIPFLAFSTYFGGSKHDAGESIAVDNAGNLFITGDTGSPDFDLLDEIEGDSPFGDIFAISLKQTGNVPSLVYSTLLGGGADEHARCIAIDSSGAVYISGMTSSTDFDVLNEIEGDSGVQDVFVAKIGGASVFPPITIPPIINGQGTADGLGMSVSSAGDFNGDGLDDILVGAPNDDNNGIDSGSAYIFFGGRSGTFSNPDGEADVVFHGQSADDRFGRAVSFVGDYNGDGIDDVVIGARNDDNNGNNAGRAFIFYGGKTGTYASPDTQADVIIDGLDQFDLLGYSVSSAGDFNGDGFADVVVGAIGANLDFSGKAYIFFGENSPGPHQFVADTDADVVIEGSQNSPNGNFGWSVSSAQDFNGDGLDDVIVGDTAADQVGSNSGSAYIFFGQNPVGQLLLSANTQANLIIDGEVSGDQLGHTVSSAGDFNNDGLDDVLVGTIVKSNNGSFAGTVYLFFGQNPGSLVRLSSDTDANLIINGQAMQYLLGNSISHAGDFNGDGFDDLIAGAPGSSRNLKESGSAYIFFGRNLPSQLTLDSDSGADLIFDGQGQDDNLGFSVSTAGDFNGDGFSDVIVGARGDDDNGPNSGSAFVFFGEASPDTTPPVVTPPANVVSEATGPLSTPAIGTATATDDVSAPGNIIITNDAPASGFPVGLTVVIWTAEDEAGNQSTATQNVTITDTTSPLITILGANPINAEIGEPYIDPWATATDLVDGAVPISATSQTGAPGTFEVVYSATDAAGNTATAIRIINVVDTTPPVITILGANPFDAENGEPYIDPGATAVDSVEGSVPVTVTSQVGANPGTFEIIYTASDSSGNTATATRVVNVVDTTPPVITILGDNPINAPAGVPYVDPWATAVDSVDGPVLVSATSQIGATPGTFEVVYSASDSSGNTATATRIVNVIP